MNLALAIEEIEKEKLYIINQFNTEIKELDSLLESLHKRNTACLKCKGEGLVFRKQSHESDLEPEKLTCNICHGTGLKEN